MPGFAQHEGKRKGAHTWWCSSPEKDAKGTDEGLSGHLPWGGGGRASCRERELTHAASVPEDMTPSNAERQALDLGH